MITNFGGNIQFTPRHVYAPKTEAEVLEILDRHANGKVRVVGSLHAWSPLVVSEDAVVSLQHFDSVALETGSDGATWATVGGGCTIKRLLEKLHQLGDVTMPSVGLITRQTIAGAISTATHGSGKHSLSHYIDEMRVAAYDPDTGKARVYVWNGGVELQAVRCALGCMGIILSVRFRCVPKYDIAETIVACASLDEVLASEDAYPLQQFYLVPYAWTWFTQRRVATPAPRPTRSLGAKLYRAWWYTNIDVGLQFIKLLACVFQSPGLIRFFYRRVLSKFIIKNRTVIDQSQRMLTMEHALFKHLETEIFVPARHLRAAASFVQAVLQVFDGNGDAASIATELDRIGMRAELEQHRGSFTHHYAVTFRRVLPDDALLATSSIIRREGEAPAEPLVRNDMSNDRSTDASGSAGASPSHGTSLSHGEEAWYAISFITYFEPRDRFLAMASFLARSMATLFHARPHWGKYFPLAKADIEGLYPGLGEFRALCRRVDPKAVFRNEFAERVIFGK